MRWIAGLAVALLVLSGCASNTGSGSPWHAFDLTSSGPGAPLPTTTTATTSKASTSQKPPPTALAWVEQPGLASAAPGTAPWTRLGCDLNGTALATKPTAVWTNPNATVNSVNKALGVTLKGAGKPVAGGGWGWDLTEGGHVERGAPAAPSTGIIWTFPASSWPSRDTQAAKAKLHDIVVATGTAPKARLVANLTLEPVAAGKPGTDLTGRVDQVVNGTVVVRGVVQVWPAEATAGNATLFLNAPTDAGSTAPLRPAGPLSARATGYVSCDKHWTGLSVLTSRLGIDDKGRLAWIFTVQGSSGAVNVAFDAFTGTILSGDDAHLAAAPSSPR